ncbi:MAG: hypothetical protein CMH30_00760 [Micavibrio sp.]|nr:hypothetical protein [Micavibrio sp.]
MSISYRKEHFFSRFGIEETLSNLEKTGESRHFTILTDSETGTIRALVFEITRTEAGYRLRCSYDVHENNADNQHIHFFDMECAENEDGRIKITEAKIRAGDILEALDITLPEHTKKLERLCKDFFDKVGRHNEWVNPIELLQEHNLIKQNIGRKAWPALYANGDIKRNLNALKNFNRSAENPIFSAFFMPALLGVAPEHYNYVGKPIHNVLSHHGKEGNDSFSTLEYTYTQGKTPAHLHITGLISVLNEETHEEKTETLYEIKTTPVKGKPKQVKISSLIYEGRKIDLKDSHAVSTILKVIRNINRTVRAGDKALIEDLAAKSYNRKYALPSELMLHTQAHQYLNQPMKIPKQGIMDLVIIGGNPSRRLTSDHDLNIGGNQYGITYRSVQADGSIKVEAAMIDAGVLFHDVFDIAFYNASRFLHHKFDKNHIPETPVDFILITHKHEDHLGQLPYLIKAGYKLPPLIMNEMTFLSLKRKMRELKIEKSIQEEILEKCYTINMLKDVNPSDPEKRKKTVIDDVTIEQWTETLPSKELGKSEHYPVLQIGSFKIRVGPMPHSDPGQMYDLITPAGSLRHTGDYSRDPANRLGLPDLNTWLRGFEPDVMTADSTGANRTERNPTELEVEEDIINIVEAHAGQRMIFPMLGSNITRLATTIHALAQTDCNTLIISGKAVQDLVRDADKAHALKEWAKRMGVTILMDSQKKAKKLLKGEGAERYAILATGTQDEPQSAMNKLVRDVNDKFRLNDLDVVCYLQGVIPVGNNKWQRADSKIDIEIFHGAKVYMPEAIAKAGELTIRHGSGHSSEDGCMETIIESGKPFTIPAHGSPAQINAHMLLAEKVGAQTMRAVHNARIRIKKGKNAEVTGTEPSSFIGIKSHAPANKFWLKGRFSTIVIGVKPDPFTVAGKLIERFENAVLRDAGFTSENALASSLPFFLSPRFNVLSGNGYLTQDFPFGIERYKKSTVFEDKEIHIVTGLDTETTGKEAPEHRIYELGLILQNSETRKTIDTKIVKQQIPDYIVPSPEAMLITGLTYKDFSQGLTPASFTQAFNDAVDDLRINSQQLALKKSTKEPELVTAKNRMKVIVAAHNKPFDQRMIEKELGRNLHARLKPFETYGIIGIDTRNISRALAAFAPQKYKPHKSPSGLDDHRLSALCDAMNIKYNSRNLHGALADTQLCLKLFWKQYDISPEIVGQMVINADSSNYHLLNDMMGMATGFNGPHPVFSYVSPSALQPIPKMGCLVATMKDDQYAVVFNLKYDPYKYMSLPAEKILAMADDRKDDVFEIIDMKKNPIVMPAKFGFVVNANAGLSRETLDYRAGIVKQYRNFIDPDDNWKTLSNKISETNEGNKDQFFRSLEQPEFPILDKPLWPIKKKGPRAEQGIAKLGQIRAGNTNTGYKRITKLLSQYVSAITDDNKKEASTLYKEIMKYRPLLETAAITINNVHYDICKKDLTTDDQNEILQMRRYISFYQYHQAMREIDAIESEPERYAHFIGRSTKKKALFNEIKRWMKSNKHLGEIDDNMRNVAHPQRKYNPVHEKTPEPA